VKIIPFNYEKYYCNWRDWICWIQFGSVFFKKEIQTLEGPTTVVHWKLFPESMRTEHLDRVVEFESDEADNILIDEAYGVELISKV
jgi:hypothetical protein